MIRKLCALLLSTVAIACPGQAIAPDFVASPDVYKVRAISDQHRIVEGTWKAGQRDAFHSHPSRLYYWVTPCTLRSYAPDGKSSSFSVVAGHSGALPPVASISLENTSASECKVVIFEAR